jgi:hypothetical protein
MYVILKQFIELFRLADEKKRGKSGFLKEKYSSNFHEATSQTKVKMPRK